MKDWKIKLQKSRNNTVLVFSFCSNPVTHRLVICLSHTVVNLRNETNEHVDVYAKLYDTIFQVLNWHESTNERPHRARRRAESHYRTPSNTEVGSFLPFHIFWLPLLHPTHFFFLKFSFQIPFSSSWVQNMVVKATCTMQSQSVWTTSNTDQAILTVRYLSWIQHFPSWKITQHMPVGCRVSQVTVRVSGVWQEDCSCGVSCKEGNSGSNIGLLAVAPGFRERNWKIIEWDPLSYCT